MVNHNRQTTVFDRWPKLRHFGSRCDFVEALTHLSIVDRFGS
jgi:hypothetical protein